MIQLNNVSAALSGAGSSLANSTDPSSLNSFESALSDAVSQTLQKFGINPSSVNISIAAAPNTSVAAASNSSSNPPAAENSSPASFSSVFKSGAAPAAVAPKDQTVQDLSAQDPAQSFDDAYWAKQPSAVQALRSTQDFDQRTQMATQLAIQGYSIDVPIMVWGWDPSQVTSLRHGYGYTWVPSALQNPVESAPGMNIQGLQAYDPKSPPAGSIAV